MGCSHRCMALPPGPYTLPTNLGLARPPWRFSADCGLFHGLLCFLPLSPVSALMCLRGSLSCFLSAREVFPFFHLTQHFHQLGFRPVSSRLAPLNLSPIPWKASWLSYPLPLPSGMSSSDLEDKEAKSIPASARRRWEESVCTFLPLMDIYSRAGLSVRGSGCDTE